jgi:hypothetical protein
MKINELVKKYIELRDQKAQFKAEYDAKVANIETLLEKMEAVFLKHFELTGSESARTDAGTVFKGTRTSAKVADRDAFFAYVKAHDAFDLLDSRCNKTAVEQFKAANDDLPPGVDWRSEVTVNVRRS